MKVLAIIPARFASTRFPGKPLIDIKGKTMIQRVYEQVIKCEMIDECYVATDHIRIAEHCKEHDIPFHLTAQNHPSGTDRVIEAYEKMGHHYDAIINIQGDEPLIRPEQIEDCLNIFEEKQDTEVATLFVSKDNPIDKADPNKVKVYTDEDNKALRFSRLILSEYDSNEDGKFKKHVGIYAFSPKALHKIKQLQPSPLELEEKLEQLRWLENNMCIYLNETKLETPAIDTPEDLKKLLQESNHLL